MAGSSSCMRCCHVWSFVRGSKCEGVFLFSDKRAHTLSCHMYLLSLYTLLTILNRQSTNLYLIKHTYKRKHIVDMKHQDANNDVHSNTNDHWCSVLWESEHQWFAIQLKYRRCVWVKQPKGQRPFQRSKNGARLTNSSEVDRSGFFCSSPHQNLSQHNTPCIWTELT